MQNVDSRLAVNMAYVHTYFREFYLKNSKIVLLSNNIIVNLLIK